MKNPTRIPHALRSALPLAAALALLTGVVPVRAVDADPRSVMPRRHDPKQLPPPVRAAEPEEKAASAAAPEARKGKAAESRDPMDVVRERLAEKLGNTKAAESPSPGVLRVAARAPAAEAGHGAARPASRAAAAGHAAKPAIPAEHEHAPHWGYDGAGGPQNWAALKPAFAKCSNGTRQSPIDIREGIRVQLDPVQFDYRPSTFRVLDNGHTVQVNVAPGNSIEVLGRRYELAQFHFHRPSEERINGRQFEMVAHLVHKDLDGRLAVVAVLFDRGPAHPVVQQVWNNLPLEKGDEVPAKSQIDLGGLLPAERGYFTYMGSLTTPPCSEGVLWMVMKAPVALAPEQIAIFAKLYPMNARPVQAAAGRLIKESQ